MQEAEMQTKISSNERERERERNFTFHKILAHNIPTGREQNRNIYLYSIYVSYQPKAKNKREILIFSGFI